VIKRVAFARECKNHSASEKAEKNAMKNYFTDLYSILILFCGEQ
jgi:hypothetical protein